MYSDVETQAIHEHMHRFFWKVQFQRKYTHYDSLPIGLGKREITHVRTFESNDGQTIQQITCVDFSQQCTGNIDENINDETQQCIVDNYVVLANVVS